MRCVNPLEGFRAVGGGWTGSRHHSTGLPFSVRCGQCIGCRAAKTRDWAVRMMHESQMHTANSVLRLSYAPEHLPPNGSLQKADYQAFAKRVRERLGPFRYFHCGEYGENEKRPHYHAVLFGLDFSDDRYHWANSPSGYPLYRSPTLESLWTAGHSTISSVSFQNCQYVAKYVVKNINLSKGTSKEAYQAYQRRYERVCPQTGEIITVEPEYATMSRRPGLGYTWYQRYKKDVFPSDFLILDGRKVPVPRYYTNLLQKEDPDLLTKLKIERKASRAPGEAHPSRLAAVEANALSRSKLYSERRN